MGSVVYTSIFGDYDILKDPVVYSDDIDYICFTDNEKFKSDVWDIRIVGRYRDNIRSSRRFKVGPHVFLKEYEYSLWIDGSLELQVIPDIKKLLDGKTIAMAKHPIRKCIYKEGVTCMLSKKDKENKITKQLSDYSKQGYPADAGLYHDALILRQHNDKRLSELSELWWYQICTQSTRDQISFPFVFKNYPVGIISRETWDEMVVIYLHNTQYRLPGLVEAWNKKIKEMSQDRLNET